MVCGLMCRMHSCICISMDLQICKCRLVSKNVSAGNMCQSWRVLFRWGISPSHHGLKYSNRLYLYIYTLYTICIHIYIYTRIFIKYFKMIYIMTWMIWGPMTQDTSRRTPRINGNPRSQSHLPVTIGIDDPDEMVSFLAPACPGTFEHVFDGDLMETSPANIC